MSVCGQGSAATLPCSDRSYIVTAKLPFQRATTKIRIIEISVKQNYINFVLIWSWFGKKYLPKHKMSFVDGSFSVLRQWPFCTKINAQRGANGRNNYYILKNVQTCLRRRPLCIIYFPVPTYPIPRAQVLYYCNMLYYVRFIDSLPIR